jgi:hypothetical protein
MSAIPVLSAKAFEERLRREPDALSRSPFVIADFIQGWPAFEAWKDLDFLRAQFGTREVTAAAPQFVTHAGAPICRVRCTYADYLDYVRRPSDAATIFAGKWLDGDLEMLAATRMPLYCGNLKIVKSGADPLLEGFVPPAPPPLTPWNDHVPLYYRARNHFWLYVSLAGACTPLHQDNNGVISYLAQLEGGKTATLFRPEDSRHYYRADLGYMDVAAPNGDEYPSWREAEPFTAQLEAGQMLIWGPNWAHHVTTRTRSITVSMDLITDLNLSLYTRAADWRQGLGQFARANTAYFAQRFPGLMDGASDAALGRDLMIAILCADDGNDAALPLARDIHGRMLADLRA